MPLNPADKKFDLDLQERVKKLEDRVKSLEGHVDKKLKPKKKKLPKAFGPEKTAKHAEFLQRWDAHDRLFKEKVAGFADGRFPKEEMYDKLIDARRALRKEGRKFRTRKDEEDTDARRAEREAMREEAYAAAHAAAARNAAAASGFPEADVNARYGVRPPVRASALGASVGSGLRYGRRF